MEERKEYKFSVDLGGMISILSDHLYSSPDVFLRELIQNGADAVNLRRSESGGRHEDELDILVEKGKKITFTDNGIGLTEQEIHEFVSVIARSSKKDGSSFIGRFGIGLLSCFIVTDEIIMRSRSVQSPEKAVEWHGFADGRYCVTTIAPDMPIGTQISFMCKTGMEKYFDSVYLTERARYYALPLPIPIYVSEGADGVKTRANVLFTREKDVSSKFVLESGRRVFGTDYDFLDYIPLESPTNLFSGAAYVLPFTVSASGSGNRHRIYLKNMLLTEDGSTLLPEWAFFVRCIINTDKLRPTASREDFFRDEMLEAAREEISACISEYLEQISLTDPEKLAAICDLHNVALMSVACENDRIYHIFMPYFLFETSYGTLTGEEITSLGKTVLYITDMDIFRQMKPIFAEQDMLLVNAAYVYVRDLLLRGAALGEFDAQPLRENVISDTLADCPDTSGFEFLEDVFDRALLPYNCHICIKSFTSSVPAIFSPNADQQLKNDLERSRASGDDMFFDMLDRFVSEITDDVSAMLYINASNDLIRRLSEVRDEEKLTTFALIIYVQSLIAGGYPVYSKDMNIMNDNLIKLIEWGI
ncbi:MAG: HSP90 family protein [Oscillospiraceae bacterium]|nr:HSP90 family protein [Oscillospiraceae bacterium]